MQSELDNLIKAAYLSKGATKDVNNVYLELLKTDLYVPVELNSDSKNNEDPYRPLFSIENNKVFMVAFDSLERLKDWAQNDLSGIDYVAILGKELIISLGEQVFLALNPGYEFYKEFNPEEIGRLKAMVIRIEQLSKG